MKGVDLHELERKREHELANLLEAREADFSRGRVTLSGATANALSRFVLLEELCAEAIELVDESKSKRRAAGREGGAPGGDQSLDL